MPGFVVNLGVEPPDDGIFTAPDDALVVVINVDRSVRGLTSIRAIVEIVGVEAPIRDVIRAIEELSDVGRLELPFADSDGHMLEFESGVVVLDGTDIGVLRAPRDREAAPLDRAGIAQTALLAMANLPGIPTTPVGLRHYRCSNGHEYDLQAGASGAPCPAGCGATLYQTS